MRTIGRLAWMLILGAVTTAATGDDDALLTVAERSDYRATALHAQVIEILDALAARSDRVRILELGRSVKGQVIPLAVVADPPVATPAEARASGKLRVLAFGNIHAGEVCGKEALLMLARELATADEPSVLRDVVLLLVPSYNADGNDRMAPDNRPGQVGPALGMGERPNAQGLDLNRDWTKLEAPETRAMVRLLTEWDPHLTIDTHTTNGSRHRYTLTYAAPLNPSGSAPSIAFVRDELLPTVGDRLRERTGYDSFFYGNFDRDRTTWATYSANPRFGGPYRGLRGQMSILSEAYAYASYRDRVLVTLEFVREILGYAAEHRTRIRALHDAARAETTARGARRQPDDQVGLRHRVAALRRPAVIRGYERGTGSPPDDTDVPHDYEVVHLGRFEAVLSVPRPYAYLLPPRLDAVATKLRQHGVAVEPFDGDAAVQAYTVTALDRAERAFQGHRLVRLDVEAADRVVSMPAGSWIVRTGQPLGTLAAYLLEPQSTDGFAAWNDLDDHLEVGREYPVYRMPSAP